MLILAPYFGTEPLSVIMHNQKNVGLNVLTYTGNDDKIVIDIGVVKVKC